MKKIIMFVILVALFALVFAACESDIVTYDESGTVILTIANEDLSASDIKVVSSDGEDDIVRSGKTITITKAKMLRTVYTLTTDGYIAHTIVVKSTDFDADRTYKADVEFTKNYVYMTLEVITDSNTVSITGSDILSYTETRSIFDVKVKAEQGATVTVCGDTAYRDQIITLTETDVLGGSIYKTVMLIPKTQTLVEISLPASMQVLYQSSPQNSIRTYNKNGKHFFVVAENSDVTFYYSAPENGIYIYYGQRLVKAAELAENHYLYLDTTDIQRSIRITAMPYMSDTAIRVMVVGEESDDGEYIPFAYNNNYYGQLSVESLFDLNRSYRVCTLGGDGKIRYKDIDVASIPFGDWRYELAIEFDDSSPVVKLTTVRMTDIFELLTDFAGVLIYSQQHYGGEPQLLGRIDSGNELVLTEGISFEQLIFSGLPEGYYSYEPTEGSAFYSELMLTGIYNIYCAPKIDLHVHFDYSGSLEGIRVDGYSSDNYYYEFFIDSNNNVIIEGFSFAVSYIVHTEALSWDSLWLNSLIGDFSNIRYENGIYSITLRLTR